MSERGAFQQRSRRWLWPLLGLLSCAAPRAASLQDEHSRWAQQAARPGDAAARRGEAWTRFVLGQGADGLWRVRAAGQADVRTLVGIGLSAHESNQVAAARDAWTAVLEQADPRDPWAAPSAELAAQRLLSLSGEAPGTKEEERAHADRVLALWRGSAKLPPEARQLLAAHVGQVLRLRGREEEARAVDAARGCPAQIWAGPALGHLPRLGLREPLPPDDPDRDPAPRYAAQPVHGCEVTLDGGHSRPRVLHAVAWVEGPRASAAPQLPLTLETGGEPWALYIDGRAVYREDEPIRRRPLWLTLPPGRHALSLKVAAPGGRATVQLALPGARFVDPPAKERSPRPTADPAPARAARRALSPVPTGSGPGDDALRGLLLGQQAYITGEIDAGLLAVAAAQQQAPRWVSLWVLQSGLLADDPTRPRAVVRDRVRRALEQALQLDPRALRARLNLAMMEQQEDRAEQALALLDAAPPDTGSAPADLRGRRHWQEPLLRYRIYKARGWLHEAEAALAEALRLGPAACPPLEALREVRAEYKDQAGVLEAARRLSRCNPYNEDYASELRAAGDLGGAAAEHRRLLALTPDSESLLQGLADVLYARGDGPALAEAERALRGLVARYPRSAGHRLKLANVLVAQGQRAQGAAVLAAGLVAAPESAELQRASLSLGGAGLLDDYRVDGQQVVAAFRADPVEGDERDAAVIVLDRTVVRAFPGGARLMLTHNIIKVLTKDGLEKFGEVQVPENAEVLTLRTIKADGTTREPEEISGKDSVSAPDLEIGDFVEFEYLDRQEPAAALPGGMLTERFYFASPEAPLYRTEYTLVTPAGMALQIDRRGDAPQPELRARGAEEVRVWARRRVPRVLPEPPQADSLAVEWLPSVRVAARLDLQAWRDYLRDRLWSVLRENDELRLLAEREAGPLPAPGALAPAAEWYERARRLDRWVRRNIKQGGSIDEDATVVLSRREGHRVVLLAALLRVAGVPFELGVARPPLSPRLDGPLADTEAYSQPLLRAFGRLWLDPHYRHAPTGFVRPGLRGARVLVLLDQHGPALGGGPLQLRTVDLPREGGAGAAGVGPAADLRRVGLSLALEPDGAGEVIAREALTGWPALEWREELERLDDAQVRKELEQRSLGFFFPGAALSELKYGPLDDDEAPFVVEYRFRAPQLARARRAPGAQASELVLPVPYPALLSKRYVGGPQRRTPLLLQYVVPTELDAQVALPAGAVAGAVAGAQALGDEFGRFRQQVEARGAALRLRQSFFMPSARVEPARYGALRQFAGQVDAAEDRAAVIRLAK